MTLKRTGMKFNWSRRRIASFTLNRGGADERVVHPSEVRQESH
jgi:hypothetical protein